MHLRIRRNCSRGLRSSSRPEMSARCARLASAASDLTFTYILCSLHLKRDKDIRTHRHEQISVETKQRQATPLNNQPTPNTLTAMSPVFESTQLTTATSISSTHGPSPAYNTTASVILPVPGSTAQATTTWRLATKIILGAFGAVALLCLTVYQIRLTRARLRNAYRMENRSSFKDLTLHREATY